MPNMDLTETIEMGLQGVINWRSRTAMEYPSDGRNQQAVDIARRLESQEIDVALLRRYEAIGVVIGEDDKSDILHHISEAESEIFRAIGFRSDYKSVNDLAVDICKRGEAIVAQARREVAA